MSNPQFEVAVAGVTFGNSRPLVLISGPCQIESRSHAFHVASALQEIAARAGVPLVFKSSYDKANRTSVDAPRGVGMDEGLRILDSVRTELDLSVLTDVHEAAHCEAVAQAVSVIQIPAFLCRQTDLLLAAGRSGAAVNVKKGQFLAPWDMANVARKIESTGNRRILLCERGTSFGYNTLVSDMRSLPVMAETGYPVVFDATHSAQSPGGNGRSSGGNREHAELLARCGVAAGCAAVFIETHENPDAAPSDGPNMIRLDRMEELLRLLVDIDAAVKESSR